MILLGVDPGANGGIAVIKSTNGSVQLLGSRKMPDSEQELWEIISSCSPTGQSESVHAIVEKVGGTVRTSAGYQGTSEFSGMGGAMFAFGRSAGLVHMALVAARIPYELVHPKTWQKHYAKRLPGESKSTWKNKLKEAAQNLFPHVKITLAVADAILLAHYGTMARRP